MPLTARPGDKLQILVENQGRIGFGAKIKDFKGITSNVTISKTTLLNWSQYTMPLHDGDLLEKYARDTLWIQKVDLEYGRKMLLGLERSGGAASFYYGTLNITCAQGKQPDDTFLSLPGWYKGVAFINGFNLGRYWPVMGPQITLYVPRTVLKCGGNKLMLMELEHPGCSKGKCVVYFTDKPIIDGPTPKKDALSASQLQDFTFRHPEL
jgi:beta-galactosidase